MANSTTNLDTISSSQASKEVTANALFDAGSVATVYARRASTTAALTWGYYGGNVTVTAGTLSQVSNGTVTLTASNTNYIVALKSTGAVSVSTATTNWNDTSNYWRLYSIVAGTSSVTSYTDSRQLALITGAQNPAAIPSSLIPSADNTYDLGSASFEWRDLYIDGTANIDSLIADSILVGTSTSFSSAAIQVSGDSSPNIYLRKYSGDTGAPFLNHGKARGTESVPVIVNSGDLLGNWQFLGYDGASWLSSASISAIVDGAPGLNSMPTRLSFKTNPGGGGVTTERMSIDKDGVVTVANNLTVNGNATLGDSASADTHTINGDVSLVLSGASNVVTSGSTTNVGLILGASVDNIGGNLLINGINNYSGTTQTASLGITHAVNPTSGSIVSFYGIQNNPTFNNTCNYTGTIHGHFLRLDLGASFNGSIGTYKGHSVHNPNINGAATITSISNYFGIDVADVNLATLPVSTLCAAYRGQMTSGTNKYNIYCSGAAPSEFSGDVKIFGSGVLGYKAGAGGTVTQATSRTTGVTLNKASGAITLVSAAGSAAWRTFTVTNSLVGANDTIRVVQKSGADLNLIHVTRVAAGAFDITFATTGGTTVEQPVFQYAVISGATA